MRRLNDLDATVAGYEEGPGETGAIALSTARRGFRGAIIEVSAAGGEEIERRLLEMGFVEGAPVELMHEGFIGRDPIAVRLADRTVALRRREARWVRVARASPKEPR
ncbi:MAG: FeoA family protein [Caulobacteraceae bacterium]